MTGGWETEISLSEETFDLVFESNGRYSKEGIRIKDAVMLLRSKSGSSSNETAFLLGTPVSEVVIIPIQYTIDENGKGKARLQLDSGVIRSDG